MQNTQLPQTYQVKHTFVMSSSLSLLPPLSFSLIPISVSCWKRGVLSADLKEETEGDNLITFGGVYQSAGTK